MKRIIYKLTFILAFLYISPVFSQIITFDFVGIAGSEISINSNTNDVNLNASTITRGSGISAAANFDRFNSENWTLNTSIDNTDYLEFSVSPLAGKMFSITNITVKCMRSGTGPLSFALRSSNDAYSTDIDAVVTIADLLTVQTLSYNTSFTNLTSTLTFRLYGYNAEGTSGTWGPGDAGGNDILINGSTANIPVTDTDSQAEQPTIQVNSGLISSASDTQAEAVTIFKFNIKDKGTTDGVQTDVTKIRLFPAASNTADWTDNIQAVVLKSSGVIPTMPQTITDTYIEIPITAGSLLINDNSSKEISVSVYLKTSNIQDGTIISLFIDADNHNFISLGSKSIFAATFSSGDIISNDFEIDVTASELRFVQQPVNTDINAVITPSVSVSATDANGNIDTDYNGLANQISITHSCLDLTNNTANPVNGLAIFPSLSSNTTAYSVKLIASGSGIPAVPYAESSSVNFAKGVSVAGAGKYYKTTGNCNFKDACNWLTADDAAFTVNVLAAKVPPDNTSETVTIENGHTATINSDIQIDQLVVSNGAFLVLNENIMTISDGTGADFTVTGTFTDNASSLKGLSFAVSANWELGATGTFIKTNNSSVAKYRDFYAGGMSNIPASANWIIRYTSDNAGSNRPNLTAINTFYPNLTIESNNGVFDMNSLSQCFTGGAGGFATVKGNLNIGGSGTGTVKVYNLNTNAQAMLIFGDLNIQSGSSLANELALNPDIGTGFEIKGNLTVNGTFDANSANKGNIIFSGATTQTITGNGTFDIYNIQINKTSDKVLINRDLTEVNNNLTITAGALEVLPAKNLTVLGTLTNSVGSAGLILRSNSSGTASLLHNTAGVAATCQKYFDAGVRHYFNMPLDNVSKASSGLTSWNLYKYIENTPDYWDSEKIYGNSGWKYEYSTTLSSDYGYIYVSQGNTVYTFTGGNLFAGNKSIPLTNTNSGTGPVNQNFVTANWDDFEAWNLVGNPFPSAFDWDNAGIVKTDIENAVYYFDGTAENYKYYGSGGIGLNGGSRYIPANQAFFVKANKTGSLQIPNSARVHSSQVFWKTKEEIPDFLKIQIENSGFTDETAIIISASEQKTEENNFIRKLFPNNNHAQIFTYSESASNMALNSVYIEESRAIPVGMRLIETGKYTINFTENQIKNYHIYFEDRTTGKIQNVNENSSYTFSFEGENYENRFFIHLEKNYAPEHRIPIENITGIPGEEFTVELPENMFIDKNEGDKISLSVATENREGLSDWFVFDAVANSINCKPELSGNYTIIVKAIDSFGETAEYKLLLQISDLSTEEESELSDIELNTKKEIILYPNPAFDILNIKNLSTSAKIEIINSIGISVLGENENFNNNQLDISYLPNGVYFVKILENEKTFVFEIIKSTKTD